jgi:hypothetical protein
MTKRTLTLLVVAVLAVGAVAAALAASLGGRGSDSTTQMHTMPNGHTMTGMGMGN